MVSEWVSEWVALASIGFVKMTADTSGGSRKVYKGCFLEIMILLWGKFINVIETFRQGDAYMCCWSDNHWFWQWLVAYVAPSHHLHQCWFKVKQIIIPAAKQRCWGVYWFHSIRPSIWLLGGWHFIAATAIKPLKAVCQYAADDILLYEFCYYDPMDLLYHLEKDKEELSPLQYHIKSLQYNIKTLQEEFAKKSNTPWIWRIIYGHKLPYMKKTRMRKQVCGAACFMAAEIKFSNDVRPTLTKKLLRKHYTINGLKSSLKKCLKKHRWIMTKLGPRLHQNFTEE